MQPPCDVAVESENDKHSESFMTEAMFIDNPPDEGLIRRTMGPRQISTRSRRHRASVLTETNNGAFSRFITARDITGNKAAFRKSHYTPAIGAFDELDSDTENDIYDHTHALEFKIAPESLKFFMYIAFWIMSIIAIVITRTVVVERLANGSSKECSTEKEREGFDFYTENPLFLSLGYSNICTNWDYSPAREITAMISPLVEYFLAIYLCLDFLAVSVSFNRGYISYKLWLFSAICFPFMVLFSSWFRMIFVITPEQSVTQHTAFFIGIQITLVLVTIQNSLYILDSRVYYEMLGGLRNTQIVTKLYLAVAVIFSILKLFIGIAFVITGTTFKWTLHEIFGGLVIGYLIDIIWMFLHAVVPIFISFVRARTEKPILITIDMEPPKFE